MALQQMIWSRTSQSIHGDPTSCLRGLSTLTIVTITTITITAKILTIGQCETHTAYPFRSDLTRILTSITHIFPTSQLTIDQ